MRKIVLLIGLILMASTSLVAQKFPKVILSGDYPDPSIMRDGKDYYMTHRTRALPGKQAPNSSNPVNAISRTPAYNKRENVSYNNPFHYA